MPTSESSSSSKDFKRKKAISKDCYGRESSFKKRSKKKPQRFKEGNKNVSFVTYDGTYGVVDKVLAFIQ